jgi:hypothetical protein
VSTGTRFWSVSKVNLVRTHFSITLLSMPNLPSGLLSSGFVTKVCMHAFPMRATLPVHLIPFDSIILIIFG